MNNIVIEKIWEDETIIEIKITAISQFVTAYQNCYTDELTLLDISKKIVEFTNNFTKDCYIQIGEKEGNYTSAFSMNFMQANSSGHVNIEMDIEIDDIKNRSHRCKYFVEGELGAIERLGNKLKTLCKSAIGIQISLYEDF